MNGKEFFPINEMFGIGLEEITDELIADLVEKGMPKKDLLFLKSEGFRYCRERDSFFSPAVGYGFEGKF